MKTKFSLEKIKLFFIKLAKTRNSIEEIAWGMAIGTFISVFPTFGFGTLLVLLFHRFFKFNLVAALAASLISNPFTSPFFMVFSFKIGSAVLGSNVEFSLENWKENLSDTGINMLIGSLIVSGSLSIIAYFITKMIVTRLRTKKKKR